VRRTPAPIGEWRGKPLHADILARVYRAVKWQPGCAIGELAQATMLHQDRLRGYLDILLRQGELVRIRDGRATRLYAAGAPEILTGPRGVLQDETEVELLAWLVANPGLTQGEIIEAMARGRSWRRSSTQYRLRRLERAGLVRTEGYRPKRHWATDAAIYKTRQARPSQVAT
jgi:predicted transcriptional regulator